MFKTDFNNTVQMIVDTTLNSKNKFGNSLRFSSVFSNNREITKPGVVVDIELMGNRFTENEGVNIYQRVKMIFLGNTSVFYYECEEGEFFIEDIDISKFENTSNHDSC